MKKRKEKKGAKPKEIEPNCHLLLSHHSHSTCHPFLGYNIYKSKIPRNHLLFASIIKYLILTFLYSHTRRGIPCNYIPHTCPLSVFRFPNYPYKKLANPKFLPFFFQSPPIVGSRFFLTQIRSWFSLWILDSLSDSIAPRYPLPIDPNFIASHGFDRFLGLGFSNFLFDLCIRSQICETFSSIRDFGFWVLFFSFNFFRFV